MHNVKTKLILFIHLIFFQFQCASAQSKVEFVAYFDSVLEPAYEQFDYTNPQTPWWQGWGWNLMAYLRMYEATQNVNYLQEFIHHSSQIQLLKGDQSIWSENMHNHPGTIVLYTGQLVHPMAEFVYLISINESLKKQVIDTNILKGVQFENCQTFECYSKWLEAKIDRSLQHMNATFWMNDANCFAKHPMNRFQRKLAQNDGKGFWNLFSNFPPSIEINFNASYGATMLYMSKINPVKYQRYTIQGQAICNYFKARLVEDTISKSYVWNHNNDPNCFAKGIPCTEDVSHGAIDIQVPIVAYKLYGDSIFTLQQLQKFAATLSRSIWDNSNQMFHNSLAGKDRGVTPDTICGTITNNDSGNFYALGEVLAWTPILTFESNSKVKTELEQILLLQTHRLLTNDSLALKPDHFCQTNTRLLSGCQSFYGFSELVKMLALKENSFLKK